jgi:hypothetical protein
LHSAARPKPSVRDIENQQRLHNLFASSAADPVPFIGVIVGEAVFVVFWLVLAAWFRCRLLSK